jgi:hypothetical protein
MKKFFGKREMGKARAEAAASGGEWDASVA